MFEKYQLNLRVTRGRNNVQFDNVIKKVLFNYIYDVKHYENELRYLNNLRDSNGDLFSRNLKVYSGISDVLGNFLTPDRAPLGWNVNYQQALEVLRAYFKNLKLTPLHYHNDDDIMEPFSKEDTHSGYYSLITGKVKKGDNKDGFYNYYQKKIEESKETNSFNEPIMIAFRTQGSGEYGNDGSRLYEAKHKTRMVDMESQATLALQQRFANPVLDVAKSFDWFAGGKDDHEINTILMNYRMKYQYHTSIDISQYDSSVPYWEKQDVFNILLKSFILNDEDLRQWNVMLNDVHSRDFILSEGLLRINKGIFSGMKWTSFLGSACNLIAIYTYLFAKDIKGKVLILGDDAIIFSSSEIDLQDMASYWLKNFGFKLNPDKCERGKSNQDPYFLSRYWSYKGPWRHPHQLFSRLLFPERFRKYTNFATPELVIYAYILMYPSSMYQLMDVTRFMSHNPQLSEDMIINRMDSRYLPHLLAYLRDYHAA